MSPLPVGVRQKIQVERERRGPSRDRFVLWKNDVTLRHLGRISLVMSFDLFSDAHD